MRWYLDGSVESKANDFGKIARRARGGPERAAEGAPLAPTTGERHRKASVPDSETGTLSAMHPLWTLLARAGLRKEAVLRKVNPFRMNLVPYSWPLAPDACPCDLQFCDFLEERGINGRSVFHFGSGGHHLIGLHNRDKGLQNEIVAITASPAEHARYVRLVSRDTRLGAYYRVLFADIYELGSASLPVFDVITLFHLCEFTPPADHPRRQDDASLLDLFRGRLAPEGRLLFYEASVGFAKPSGRPGTREILAQAVDAGKLRFDEKYKTLLVYRV